jgi:hypothetical protein
MKLSGSAGANSVIDLNKPRGIGLDIKPSLLPSSSFAIGLGISRIGILIICGLLFPSSAITSALPPDIEALTKKTQ